MCCCPLAAFARSDRPRLYNRLSLLSFHTTFSNAASLGGGGACLGERRTDKIFGGSRAGDASSPKPCPLLCCHLPALIDPHTQISLIPCTLSVPPSRLFPDRPNTYARPDRCVCKKRPLDHQNSLPPVPPRMTKRPRVVAPLAAASRQSACQDSPHRSLLLRAARGRPSHKIPFSRTTTTPLHRPSRFPALYTLRVMTRGTLDCVVA